MPDQPVGHEAAVAAAGDPHALLVDVSLLQQGIRASHDIERIFLAPDAAHSQGKVLAIADAASWIGVQNDIACRSQ